MAARQGSSSQVSAKPQVKDIEGYVHEVSQLKIPRSGTANRYFDFTIQEKEQTRRVCCFNPNQRDDIKEKELNKSPVRLMNVSPQKRKYVPDTTEYRFNNYSKITVVKNLAFPWKDVPKETSNETTIKDILNETGEGQFVSVKAKVMFKGESETVFSTAQNKNLKKSDIVIADHTGAIPLTVWEEAVTTTETDHSYLFSKVRVSFFKRKYLNATKNSVFVPCKDEIQLTQETINYVEHLKPNNKNHELVVGKILSIDVQKSYICLNCKSKINGVEDADEDSQFTECNTCRQIMLRENLNASTTANLTISQEGQNIGRFFCSGNVLNSLLQSLSSTENYNIEQSATKLSRKMITQTLLLLKKVSFQLSKEDKVIHAMNAIDDP